MPTLRTGLGGLTVDIEAPDSWAETLANTFTLIARQGDADAHLRVGETETGQVVISAIEGDQEVSPVAAQEGTFSLRTTVIETLAAISGERLVLYAGLVVHQTMGILIASPQARIRGRLTSFMLRHQSRYASDSLVRFGAEGIDGFGAGLVARHDQADQFIDAEQILGSEFDDRIKGHKKTLLPFHRLESAVPESLRLILIPEWEEGAELSIEQLSAAQAGLHLMQSVPYSQNGNMIMFAGVSRLAQTAPALKLRFGKPSQLDAALADFLKLMAEQPNDPALIDRLIALYLHAPNPAKTSDSESAVLIDEIEIPEATPSRGKVKLTIGMATYDDYDGVYFSTQAIRMYHPEVLDQTEIIVVDNNPTGRCAQALKQLDQSVPGYRYLPNNQVSGTAAPKNFVFEAAEGEYVMCMDSHVMLVPGAIQKLINFLDEQPGCMDLLQGPLVGDNLKSISTHFQQGWSGGMYGAWATDERGQDMAAEPFEIPMQGMGLFACRKAAWLGFNPQFSGFGGEESYIHEKFRQAGQRTLCLPFLRWLHRFNRPMGVPYHNDWEDRVRNYLIGLDELNLPITEMRAHFNELIGEELTTSIVDRVTQELADEPQGNKAVSTTQ